MHNFVKILCALTLVACACNAVPLRMRKNAKFLSQPFAARQQVAPYPPAGLKPKIPFDLPSETEATPMNTYLPPTVELEPRTPATTQVPDTTTAAEEDELAEDIDPIAADAEEDDAANEEEEDENVDILPFQQPQSARLVFGARLKPRKRV